MTAEELFQITIEQPDSIWFHRITENWDKVAKPLNGLGKFEKMLARIGAIRKEEPTDLRKRAVIAMCADNGIVEEGVSQSGQEVTAVVTRFMGEGKTSVGKMAKVAGVDVIPVDIGVNWSEEPVDLWKQIETEQDFLSWVNTIPNGILKMGVCKGTENFLVQPAMRKEEAIKAIETGVRLVKWCKQAGYKMVATGEMGIGNTTTSSAIAATLLGCRVEEVTGKGAGLSKEGLNRKCNVIKQALKKYGYLEGIANDSEKESMLEILCNIGGLDIAGMAGICIGGAMYQIPVVLDGVISAVAALVAERLVPGVKEYLIPSHVSREVAAHKILDLLSLDPVLYGDLALGEGTGAVMLFSLLDVAMALYESDTTFSSMKIEQYEHF